MALANLGKPMVDKKNATGVHLNALFVLFLICLACETTLVLLDLFVNWQHWSDSRAIRRMFNITREDGLASLFAVIQTAVVASVCWLIYFIVRLNRQSKRRFGWLILALFFTYMMIDDGAMVHERIGTAFKSTSKAVNFPSYTWQLVIAPFFIAMGAYMAWFIWQERNIPVKRSWLILAFTCLGVAVVLDFFEGVDNAYVTLIEVTGLRESIFNHFSKSLEEFLEMLGMSFFLIFFLDYLAQLTDKVEIKLSRGKIIFLELDNTKP